MTASRGKTRDMAQAALFAVVIAVCAWISVPTAVPFTMQTFGVFLAMGVLGGKRGTLAVCVYLLLGLAGVPVFAGGTAGVGVLMGATGGYLLAWMFAGLVVWGMEAALGRKTWVLALSLLLGLAACYALGTAWFMAVYARQTGPIGVGTALTWCVLPFLVPDLLKLALALLAQKRLVRFVR